MNCESMTNSDPEQRLLQRRRQTDRRARIRYERSKELRRKNNGRRLGELKDIWDIS